ncbi:hypothetical protein ACFYOF_20945 [Streptomyces sp. NPDC007148]|uniref:hypothetical protein n=1 Tax=Streptomyces sp. NPDC007148 TaxID=3364775 RepID=UPI0036AAD7EF
MEQLLQSRQPAGRDELINDPWTVNRGEINLSARTEAAGPARPPAPVEELYGFEDGTSDWNGYLTLHGPWSVTEWASQGTYSLKADIDLASPESYLNWTGTTDLSSYGTLTAAVRTAPWGNHAAGTHAKLYLRTGSAGTWYDSGETVIDTNGAMLTIDLSKVRDLNDVREIGVRITPATGASGQSAVYVDDVSATRPPTTFADFEDGADSWIGYRTKAGPWSVTEWAAMGTHSFKADVDLTAGSSILYRYFSTPVDWSGRTTFAAVARTAPWGNHADGTRAKLYVRSGPDCTWHDGGTHPVDSAGTALSYNLTGVAGLNHVCEAGVQFIYASGASGGSAVYVDHATLR